MSVPSEQAVGWSAADACQPLSLPPATVADGYWSSLESPRMMANEVKRWRWRRWLVAVSILVVAVGSWFTLRWWLKTVEGLAALREQQRVAATGAPAGPRRAVQPALALPAPYRYLESVPGDVHPAPGNETVAIGAEQTSGALTAFVIDAAGAVAFATGPLPARPYALEVRGGASAAPRFLLYFPDDVAAAGPKALAISWDGNAYVAVPLPSVPLP